CQSIEGLLIAFERRFRVAPAVSEFEALRAENGQVGGALDKVAGILIQAAAGKGGDNLWRKSGAEGIAVGGEQRRIVEYVRIFFVVVTGNPCVVFGDGAADLDFLAIVVEPVIAAIGVGGGLGLEIDEVIVVVNKAVSQR